MWQQEPSRVRNIHGPTPWTWGVGREFGPLLARKRAGGMRKGQTESKAGPAGQNLAGKGSCSPSASSPHIPSPRRK